MASLAQRYQDNAEGDFYVDRTCIDCDACRRIAPAVFAEAADHSYVRRQPETDEERRRSLMALVSCPTGSIGTASRADVRPGLNGFPERLEENVFFCGFTSSDSFGAFAYFIERPEGNVLVDSPRSVSRLLSEFDRRGGVATLFLTHRDDVADHAVFARKFGCRRVLHAADVSASTRAVETKLSGRDPVSLEEDLLAIPTPGHTRGHAVLLYRERYLFTGDHLAWSARHGRLVAFRDACWYSWEEQIRSMEALLDFRFEWVLPGHGAWHRAESAEAMRTELERCVRWMKTKI
jgi:glyoxylase-like metal-dependent hydrolase (beta-lactamase superfamily II)/ferredoxin